MSDDDRVAKGRELAARLLAGAPPGRRLPPEFMRQTMGNVFGDVWQGPDLELEQRSLITCTVLVALGGNPSSGCTSAAPATSASSGRRSRR